MPAIAPPDILEGEFVSDVSPRSGATIGVEVTVWVTASPEMVTTRVLVTGEGVSDIELEVVDVGSGEENEDEDEDDEDDVDVDVEVGGGGVELVDDD